MSFCLKKCAGIRGYNIHQYAGIYTEIALISIQASPADRGITIVWRLVCKQISGCQELRSPDFSALCIASARLTRQLHTESRSLSLVCFTRLVHLAAECSVGRAINQLSGKCHSVFYHGTIMSTRLRDNSLARASRLRYFMAAVAAAWQLDLRLLQQSLRPRRIRSCLKAETVDNTHTRILSEHSQSFGLIRACRKSRIATKATTTKTWRLPLPVMDI